MKKNIILTALALAATVAAGANTADELRVYINPGHGGWTPDDRPCTLVGHGPYSRTNTDTLSFFESNTDLEKGFGVLERLIQYGLKFDRTLNQTGDNATTGAARDMNNNIVMSRVKNGPYPPTCTYSTAISVRFAPKWTPTTSTCSSPSTPTLLPKVPTPTSRCSSIAAMTPRWTKPA